MAANKVSSQPLNLTQILVRSRGSSVHLYKYFLNAGSTVLMYPFSPQVMREVPQRNPAMMNDGQKLDTWWWEKERRFSMGYCIEPWAKTKCCYYIYSWSGTLCDQDSNLEAHPGEEAQSVNVRVHQISHENLHVEYSTWMWALSCRALDTWLNLTEF